MAAPVLTAAQRAAIERMTEAARSRDLRVIGRGVCKVAPFAGARVFAVQSSTRPARAHLVWIANGRLMCTCEARKNPHIFTCSHAQAVRLALLAEAAQPRSIPTPAPDPNDDSGASAQPSRWPPAPRGGATCPTCGFPADPDEIEQLGECLDCLQEANRAEEKRPPVCACGQIATGETADGFVCDECAARILAERKAEQERRKAESAARIIAREDARQKKNARTRAAIQSAKASATEATAKHATAKTTRTRKSADRENPNPAPTPAPVRREDAIFRTKTHAGRA